MNDPNAMPVAGESRRDRLVPFSSKFAFGVGQFAEGLKNTGFSVFILFYYNQVLGLPGTLAGTALFIALMFDAVTDPLAGSLSDNHQSRLGRRHPFMYASALPLGLAFIGLFSPPGALGDWGLFAWLTVFAILTRAAMTLYHVPHLALGAEMTENFSERTRIVAYRQFFSAAGTAAAWIIGLTWFFADAKGLAAENYPPYAVTLAVLMVVTIWYSAYGTQKEVPFLVKPTPRPKSNPARRLFLDLSEGFRNRSFTWLFGGVLVISSWSESTTFWISTCSGTSGIWSPARCCCCKMAVILGMLIGAFLTAPLIRRTDKRFGVLLGTVVWSICQVVPVVMRLVDALPANGTEELVWTLAGFKFIQGLIMQQALVAFGSMMADVADEHELTTGVRQEGVFFGAIAFSGKATSGFGNLIGGIGSGYHQLAARAGNPDRRGHSGGNPRRPGRPVWPRRGRSIRGLCVVLCALQPHASASRRDPRRPGHATPRTPTGAGAHEVVTAPGLARRGLV